MHNESHDQIQDDQPSDAYDTLREKCGIVAVWSKDFSRKLPFALVSAGGVQHRGQQGAGFCAYHKEGMITHHGSGLLKEVFPKKKIEELDQLSQWVMVHCRYGTYGDWETENIQPCLVKDHYSKDSIVVIHNGQFTDVDGIRKKLNGNYKEGVSDTYLFTQLLAQSKGSTWDERLLKTIDQVDGAFSLMIGIEKTLYFVRDRHGLRPFVMGKVGDHVIAASETHALDKAMALKMSEVNPGAVIRLNQKGVHHLRRRSNSSPHFCDLERAYFSRPDSMVIDSHSVHGKTTRKWTSFSAFRYTCGKKMAETLKINHASFVVGVPDSGIAVATGYAIGSGLPYKQVIIRDHHDLHGDQRLFLKDDEKTKIGSKVLGKLSLIQDEEIWEGAVVVIADDSLIRGNVSAQITKAVFEMGASEVHWMLGFPPVRHRCHLGVSMRTEEELIAAKYNGDALAIAKAIGATSVNYISNEAFVRTYRTNGRFVEPKNPEDMFLVNGGCGGCITGKYPV